MVPERISAREVDDKQVPGGSDRREQVGIWHGAG